MCSAFKLSSTPPFFLPPPLRIWAPRAWRIYVLSKREVGLSHIHWPPVGFLTLTSALNSTLSLWWPRLQHSPTHHAGARVLHSQHLSLLFLGHSLTFSCRLTPTQVQGSWDGSDSSERLSIFLWLKQATLSFLSVPGHLKGV